MTLVDTYINKRNSTRDLTDAAFELLVPQLAAELVGKSILFSFTDDELHKDWDNLCAWKSAEQSINSSSRLGMKLSEHFCPNFFDIKNSKGVSFKMLWTQTNLEKILRWNRKSHSTPYMSEIKRGIYFCCGMTKNTMYRPQMMKLACMTYSPKVILDPCAGWGGRMLGAVSSGADYIGFEPNTTTFANLQKMVAFLGIGSKVTLICDDALNMKKYNLPKVDMVLTSPPYFDLEVYADEATQSITKTNTYQDWADQFLQEIIRLGIDHLNPGGVSCWNVGKVRNRDMKDDVQKYHTAFGFSPINVLAVKSSKRQSNQAPAKNSKSSDDTVIFKQP